MSGHLLLHTSNQLETLAQKLAANLQSRDLFTPVEVVTPTQGMGRWVSLQLADALGICANVQFPFPKAALRNILSEALGGFETSELLEPENLQWVILKLLPQFDDAPALAHYLKDADYLMRLQLASALAQTVDRYLVYRPDMVLRWEQSPTAEDWQAKLWALIRTELGDPPHLAAGLRLFLSQQPKLDRPPLHFFGLAATAPIYIDFLRLIGEQIPVHLYLLQPTPLYWGDATSPKVQARQQLPFDGNRLIGSLGKQGRDFFNKLIDCDFHAQEYFCQPNAATMLGQLQERMLAFERDPVPYNPQDSSIEIVSCHSPMREVEALHDYLLDAFEQDPTLEPSQVIVLAPRIEDYAPYIQAVFNGIIPCHLADRAPQAELPMADLLLRLLDYASGRNTSRELLELLELPALRERFALSEDDFARFRTWVIDANVRWGRDQKHRARFGADTYEHSWQFGLDRMLMGFATGDSATAMGIAPLDSVSESDLPALDRLCAALHTLCTLLEQMETPMPLAQWCQLLMRELSELFPDSHNNPEGLRLVYEKLADLKETAETLALEELLDARCMRATLEGRLGGERLPGGFLQGGVTFAQMRPMRCIPAKLICLLGLNEKDFPRQSRENSFDKLLEERREGDPSTRESDRYLFLETLLSVRERLYISYCGRSMTDETERPPSVIVAELADAFTPALLTKQHRMQAFSKDYFSPDSALYSYSIENCNAAKALQSEKHSARFYTQSLPEPEPITQIDIADLAQMLVNAPAFFAKVRLGMELPRDADLPPESEPIELDGLDRYKLRASLLETLEDGRNEAQWLERQLKEGAIINAATRHDIQGETRGEVQTLQERLEALCVGTPEPPRYCEKQVGSVIIHGRVGPLYGGQLVLRRYGKLKLIDRMTLFLALLLQELPSRGAYVGLDGVIQQSVADDVILETYVKLYLQALREPLPLLDQASFDFAEQEHKLAQPQSRASKDPMERAQAAWYGGYNQAGLCEDAVNQLFFKEETPLDERFRELARLVWNPVLEATL